jgi:integrase
VGLHDLRHSFAAAALEQLSLPEASFLLRHANARVTAQIYAGLTDDARKQATGKLAKAGFGR